MGSLNDTMSSPEANKGATGPVFMDLGTTLAAWEPVLALWGSQSAHFGTLEGSHGSQTATLGEPKWSLWDP